MNNFWNQFNKPIFIAAPMEDVTDTAFRVILEKYSEVGKLNCVFTEFVATDGLCHQIGFENVSHRFFISNEEKKLLDERGIRIVAQIWGANPENFYKSIQLIQENYNFDGIDINMGCPMKKVTRQNGGAYLIKEPSRAIDIIEASKSASKIPISVKTRIGDINNEIETWMLSIAGTKPAAITLHGRTRSMMYKGEADWQAISDAAKIVKNISPETVFIGNGDVHSIEEAQIKTENYQIDGVMIGRAMQANPFVFSSKSDISISDRINVLLEHTRLYTQIWQGQKPFSVLKKFFKSYINSFNGASELRHKLMQCNSLEDVENLFKSYSF